MFDPDPAAPGVDVIAHIIQTALTPVFLLSGIASLIGVFATRLARVSDRSHAVAALLDNATEATRPTLEAQVRFLHRRTRLLDAAVVLGTAGGGATCAAALLLFVGTLRDSTVSGLLFISFGLALACTIGALTAFLAEVLLASRGLRARQQAAVRRSERRRRGFLARAGATGQAEPGDAPANRPPAGWRGG